jgi:hypothetical protein
MPTPSLQLDLYKAHLPLLLLHLILILSPKHFLGEGAGLGNQIQGCVHPGQAFH